MTAFPPLAPAQQVGGTEDQRAGLFGTHQRCTVPSLPPEATPPPPPCAEGSSRTVFTQAAWPCSTCCRRLRPCTQLRSRRSRHR